jgi:Ras-related protein Rab-21
MEQFKLVLLGGGRVGKTSILLRFTKGEYSDKQVSTLQASFLDKKITVGNPPTTVQLSIWDTAGQERFHALGPIYYRDANGALIVYDVGDAESFQEIQCWDKEFKRICGGDAMIIIVGNKFDLYKDEQCEKNVKSAEKYAVAIGALHFRCSAKQNRGLDEVFHALAEGMINKKFKSGLYRDRGTKQKLIIVDTPPEKSQGFLFIPFTGISLRKRWSQESFGILLESMNQSYCGTGEKTIGKEIAR